jgi:glutaminyl-peptide cyclotransferase
MLNSLQRRVQLAAVGASVLALAAVAGPGCNPGEPPAFSADSAVVHIGRQLAFGPRVPGTAARDSAADYIARTLKRYGASVTVQPFEVDNPYGAGRIRMLNVIGSFSVDAKRRLMLASHYDSRPWADQEKDSTLWNTPIPAAVDGAASTAILLEVARIAGTRPPTDIGLDLVFFDGEDYGKHQDIDHYLLGSRHFVSNLEGYHPVAAILLDMVGGAGTQVRREGTSEQRSKALLDYVFARAKDLDLKYFENIPGAPMIDDHVPLLMVGFHAIDLFAYDFAPWHTLGDDASAVDRSKVEQTGILLRDLVYHFDYGK